MSEIMELLRHRRSVRSYTDEEIPREDLLQILEAGLLAPTGRNTRSVRLWPVTDRDTLKELSHCRVGAAKMLEGAAAAVVVLYESRVTDTGIEDCSLALGYMHLAADALGYGSCWIQCRGREAQTGVSSGEYLRQVLHFSRHLEVEAVLSLGVPAAHPAAQTIGERQWEQVLCSERDQEPQAPQIQMNDLYEDHLCGRSETRPEKKDILLDGPRGHLLCTYYMASPTDELHPAVLLCHGYPGNEQNLDVAHALHRIGFHVMTFHYSGSWGSDGDFSFAHCIEDTEAVLDRMLEDPGLGVDPDALYLWGQSMGSFVSVHLMADRRSSRNRPSGAVLAMPCDFGVLGQQAQTDPQAADALRELLASGVDWLKGTSTEVLYDECLALADGHTFADLAPQLSDYPMLMIGGALDEVAPPSEHIAPLLQAGEKARQQMLFTGHMAIDARIHLTRATAEFLTEQVESRGE